MISDLKRGKDDLRLEMLLSNQLDFNNLMILQRHVIELLEKRYINNCSDSFNPYKLKRHG